MKYIADLHIHSKYSRACSKDLMPEKIAATCVRKGIDLIASGDFTHPAWFNLLKNSFKEDGSGFYALKNSHDKVKFILSSEVALIYKDTERVRRIHLVIHAPSLAAVEKLNKVLGDKFNLKSDGRPILGISAPNLVKLILDVDEKFIVYPAHIWTPWFSVFGSKSGFDNLADCFKDEVKNIFAYETGLSSDPEMNWRVSELDRLVMLSNSDAHSLANLAREANIIDLENYTYDCFYQLLKTGRKDLVSTIEFFPEEGMYHWDGHRDCAFSCPPEETKKLKGVCPKCAKPLIIGVDYRVQELADRPVGFKPKNVSDFIKLVELDKIIAEAFDIKSRSSKAVQAEYNSMIDKFGSELKILRETSLADLKDVEPRIVEGIKRVREGKLYVKPGFDGQYGQVKIFADDEKRQKTLI